MRFIHSRILFFVALLASFQVFSQDDIYTSGDKIPCKINDITSSSIKYTTDKGKSADLALNKALILFNQRGFFLIPQKLNFGEPQTERLIKEYLNPTSFSEAKDYLYLNTQARYEGNIMNDQKKTVVIGTESGIVQVSKDDIVVTVHKDGRHQVNGSVKKASEILGAYQTIILPEQIKENLNTIGDVALSPGKTSTTGIQATPVVQKPSTTVPAAKENTNPPVSQTSAPVISDQPQKKLAVEDVVANRTQGEFKKKAEQKTNQLNTYLVIICNKSAEKLEIDRAIDQALNLFVDENATVEISSINSDEISKRKIKQYLSHLKFVQYDKIEISWSHVQYVGDLKKGTDGNFYGTVSFDQLFRGFKDGNVIYEDITRKNATVILKGYKKNIQGATVDDWEVLLGDIGVISTKPVNAQP